MNVTLPQGEGVPPVVVTNVRGEAGHLLLHVDQYAVPFFVSFRGMTIREAPDESQSGEHEGYFDNHELAGSWSHSVTNGAGRWQAVGSDGKCGSDMAGRSGRYERPWCDGWMEWPIPMEYGWAEIATGAVRPNPVTLQRFVLESDGSFSIGKHGYFARRNIWGVIWLNGKLYSIR